MCGDPNSTTATVDSGDLIAIIHSNLQSSFRGRLRLSNRLSGATVSHLQCNQTVEMDSNGFLHVRIHKYGQPIDNLTRSAFDDSSFVDLNPVVHSFFVQACDNASAGARLNLGVGDDGVVGRTVSIMHGRRFLGQGVIGWG